MKKYSKFRKMNPGKIPLGPKKSPDLNFGLKIRKNTQNNEIYSRDPEK